jgi:hypothetical protein
MVESKSTALRRALRRASVPGSLALGALLIAAIGIQSTARAQRVDTAWYRVVNVGQSSGTMARFERLGQGYTGTFPFMDNFQISIRPDGQNITLTVADGASRVISALSCTAANAPRRSKLVATRATQGSAQIVVDVQCSATEPPAR